MYILKKNMRRSSFLPNPTNQLGKVEGTLVNCLVQDFSAPYSFITHISNVSPTNLWWCVELTTIVSDPFLSKGYHSLPPKSILGTLMYLVTSFFTKWYDKKTTDPPFLCYTPPM